MKKPKGMYPRAGALCIAMLFAIATYAQTISGSVYDTFGVPVLGASVIITGTQKGAITDIDGKFSVDCQAGATLRISYIGFKTQEVAARQGMRITLEENVISDDFGVVVIGYGSARKSDVTGSIAMLSTDPKTKGFAPNANDLLVGKIAGVSVISGGGAATDGASIRVRGGSSLLASNDPLIIVDGVYFDNGGIGGVGNGLSVIAPNDIESFTVLKDASATAIYGSRASNGVILVTTKKGQAGKITLSYDGNVSVSTRKNSVDVLNGDEYRDFIHGTFAGLSNQDEVYAKLGDANTDWQKEIFRSAISTEHNVAAAGSIGKVLPFRLSLDFTDNNGILKTDHMERYTANLMLTPTFFDNHLKVTLNGKGMYIKSNFANRTAIGSAVMMDPTHPVYDAESKYGGYWSWVGADGNILNVATKNPVSMLEAYDDHANATRFIGSAQVEYNAFYVPGLKVNMDATIDASHSSGNTSAPFDSPSYANFLGFNNDYTNTRTNTMFDLYATYATDIEPINSHFDIMAGYQWQHYWARNYNNTTSQFQYDDNGNLEPVPSAINENTSETEHYIVSFFGRMNYSYADKYLLTFTLRDDGSSRFGPGNKYGLFPSLALAWRLTEESFMQNQDVFNNLKLRLGWGLTGQQDINQGDYPYLGSYSYGISNASSYYRNGQWIQLLQPNAYNPDLKWETTRTYNVGVDMGFANGRVNASLDYYYRKTYNLINVEAQVAAGTNFAEYVVSNIGSMSNTGVELQLNTVPVRTKDWTWELNGNVAFNKSKILQLSNGDASTSMRRFDTTGGDGGFQLKAHAVGHEPGMYYVYEQVYDTNGKAIEGSYVDRNDDGLVNEGDMYLRHSAEPRLLYGISSKLQYKGWDFSVAGHGSLGNYNYNAVAANDAELAPARLYANEFLINVTRSAFDTNFQTKKVLSDYYVQNASFFRIDNITLGYSFKNILNSKLGGRVYATVQNPLVFTPYKGLDPEISNGEDTNFYPRPLTMLFGLSLNL